MRSWDALRWPGLAVAVTLLGLTGCASMSKDECLAVDWRTVGYEDGVQGYPGDHIAQHRKACAKYGVRADLALYQEGRSQGLVEFCQPINGYNLGVRGGAYRGVCPAQLEPTFKRAYDAGRELYVMASRVSGTQAELDAKRRELGRVEHGIVESSAAAISSEGTAEQRAQAVLDAAHLAEEAGRLKVEIRQLNEDSVRYQAELDAYRATHPPIT
jgi:hypothetical protein